jgi:DNA-binding FadR family transcriptional regulator
MDSCFHVREICMSRHRGGDCARVRNSPLFAAQEIMMASQIVTRMGRVAGHDDIVAILGSEILSGARPPGSRMPSPTELYERFGVSRMLLREVTKTLAAKGMIAAKSRVGTTVLPPEYWNWFDPDVLSWRIGLGLDADFFGHLAEMRRGVEPAAASLAARRRSAAHIAEMRGALAEMAGAGADRRRFADADLKFHIAIASASGNPLVRSFANVVETALAASFSLSAPIQHPEMEKIVARHSTIADAIEAGDSDEAARAMLAVIEDGVDRIARERPQGY